MPTPNNPSSNHIFYSYADALEHRFYRWLFRWHLSAVTEPTTVDHALFAWLQGLDRGEEVVSQLPLLPQAVIELLAMLGRKESSTTAIVQTIARDPGLLGDTIRLANSVYIAPQRPIENLDQAVVMLGLDGLRRLAAQTALHPLFLQPDDEHARRAAQQLWSLAQRRAYVATRLAPSGAGNFAVFLAAMMHDIGLLVALRRMNEVASRHLHPRSSDFLHQLHEKNYRLRTLAMNHWTLPTATLEVLASLHHIRSCNETSPILVALAAADYTSKFDLLVRFGRVHSHTPERTFASIGSFGPDCIRAYHDLLKLDMGTPD